MSLWLYELDMIQRAGEKREEYVFTGSAEEKEAADAFFELMQTRWTNHHSLDLAVQEITTYIMSRPPGARRPVARYLFARASGQTPSNPLASAYEVVLARII